MQALYIKKELFDMVNAKPVALLNVDPKLVPVETMPKLVLSPAIDETVLPPLMPGPVIMPVEKTEEQPSYLMELACGVEGKLIVKKNMPGGTINFGSCTFTNTNEPRKRLQLL